MNDVSVRGNNISHITSVRRLGTLVVLVVLVGTLRKVHTSQARVRVRVRHRDGATLLLIKDLWEHSSMTSRSVSFHPTGSNASD